jgi:hypothetical protein
VQVGREGNDVFETFTGLTQQQADEVSTRGLKETAAATAIVKDSQGNVVTEDFLGDERGFQQSRSDPSAFIEKRDLRIQSQGELEDITFKSLQQNEQSQRVGPRNVDTDFLTGPPRPQNNQDDTPLGRPFQDTDDQDPGDFDVGFDVEEELGL